MPPTARQIREIVARFNGDPADAAALEAARPCGNSNPNRRLAEVSSWLNRTASGFVPKFFWTNSSAGFRIYPGRARVVVGLGVVLFKPATGRSDAILRPICQKCGTRMMLARIEPDHPGYERRTFECSACDHSETIVAKFD